MNAAGILRVGIFTLIISTTLRAETIPFDYWYGRIIGADRAALEYLDGRSDLAQYLLSLGIGSKGKYELFSPDRYIYIPNRSSNKLSSTNAGLNWIQKTPFHSRYEFTLLSHLNEKYDYVSNGYNGVNDVDDLSFSHSLQVWSGDSLAFDPKAAAFMLLDGPWYSATDFHVVIDNLILRNDNNRDFNIIREQPSATLADTGKSDAAEQQTDISGSATIGLGRGYQANITFHTNKQKRSSTTRRRYQWIYDEGAFIDTTDQHNASHYDDVDRAGRIEVTNLLQPTIWAGLSYQYLYEAHSNEGFYHAEYLGGFGGHIDQRIDVGSASDYAHEVVGRLTWLSRNQVIERQRLLDNFRGYYGDELERGTFLMQSEFRWYRERSNLRSTSYEGTENEVVDDDLDVHRTHELSVSARLSYYLRPNVTTGAKLQIERSVLESPEYYDPDFHNTQLTTLSYWFEFRSYRWQADKRREISWDEVSDIDYLLGPMLRKADLRI
ncbi:MAG: hypothetical protein WBP29_12050 [Candidatus Zixiibacteriota bacterium]